MTKSEHISDAVKMLDWASNHFAHSDWDYTRHSNIKSIRYEKDIQEKLLYRTKLAFRRLFNRTNSLKQLQDFLEDKSLLDKLKLRLGMFFYAFKKVNHCPDGILDGGAVIVFWEETGEYLQLVQPSVGSLLADFLMEEPEHPHAKLIIAEMERIQKRFKKRIEKGEVE